MIHMHVRVLLNTVNESEWSNLTEDLECFTLNLYYAMMIQINSLMSYASKKGVINCKIGLKIFYDSHCHVLCQ